MHAQRFGQSLRLLANLECTLKVKLLNLSYSGLVQIKEDPEWEQFSMVPNLTEGWNDVRDKLSAITEEFKVWYSCCDVLDC